MTKFFLLSLVLLFTLSILSSDASAQPASRPPVRGNRVVSEIDRDSLRAEIRAKGAATALNAIYLQRAKRQLEAFEAGYVKMESNADSVQGIVRRVIDANPNEVTVNAIDLSQGNVFNVRKFERPAGGYRGRLSSYIERQIFDLKWTTKNREPLLALKAKDADFAPELERILVNEADAEKLVEAKLREIIYERVRQRLVRGFNFELNDKDVLARKLGMETEIYLLNNYRDVLAKKSTEELTGLLQIAK
ncbi:MAG: hypothetical protein IAF08_12795 [Rhizobacter sp.]|nr:hypothetical protein [Chlorobiales bacterium]